MARINVSVPDQLKERMDKHPAINWSQTASEAFLNKINETELTIEVRDMTSAIVRLKASKAEFETENETVGYASGIQWAMQSAEYRQLNKLNSYERADGYVESMTTKSGFEFIVGEGRWPIFEDDTPDTPEFISGFIEGALEVFDKIEES